VQCNIYSSNLKKILLLKKSVFFVPILQNFTTIYKEGENYKQGRLLIRLYQAVIPLITAYFLYKFIYNL